jgi:hypothetical protein
VSSRPPRYHRTCGFHRIRRPPERSYWPECSIGIGQASQACTSDGVTAHLPLQVWPFPLYAAFPRSEYYGHADAPMVHCGTAPLRIGASHVHGDGLDEIVSVAVCQQPILLFAVSRPVTGYTGGL